MTEDTNKRLTDQLGTARWDELIEHDRQGNVVVVAAGMDILLVAKAVADDDTAQVQKWLDGNKLWKPTVQEQGQWQEHQPKFLCVIVRPFVLVQLST